MDVIGEARGGYGVCPFIYRESSSTPASPARDASGRGNFAAEMRRGFGDTQR